MHVIKTQSKNRFALKHFFGHLFKDHILESSATLSYYFLFSVFPLAIFISACFSTLGLTPKDLADLSGFIPEDILSIIDQYLLEISLGNTPTLIAIGILLTLSSMGKAIQTMKRKIRLSYGVYKKSKGLFEWVVSFVFVLLILVSFYATLILIVAGNYIFQWLLSFIPFLKNALPSFSVIRLLGVTGFLFFFLLGLYYVLPGIKQKMINVIPGTLFALVGWVAMSYVFSFYLDHFANFSAIYGSLGAIIALLTWLFLLNFILLLGGRINSYFYLMQNERSYA